MDDKDNINRKNGNGLTLLHLAAVNGDVDEVQQLLSLGADPTIMNDQQQYPLFSTLIVPAIYDDNTIDHKIKIFNLLKPLTKAAINHQDDSGDTVVHQMARQDFVSLMKPLLEADVTLAAIQNKQTCFPIHLAILQNTLPCVRLLLGIDGASTLADNKGQVPLHYAALCGTDEVLKACCEHAGDVNPVNREGQTPYWLAKEKHNTDAMAILASFGARVN